MAETIEQAVARRRTFAIIAHPDAGKTTLTEKLLLFGGAIQLAGEVKAKKDRMNTRSDWMKIERERGISVVTSVMTFEYGDNVFNLLDTPGHEDFADDTYRTLSAVDSAVMVIDAAKGIEPRTLKLFEVCRLRDIPIVTFVNKMDREARNTFEILDEIEAKLALDTAPITWPIGQGKSFSGTYHLAGNAIRHSDTEIERTKVNGPDSNRVAGLLPENEREAFIEELELAREACRPFDLDAFREGHLTPVFFGSALRNFGVRDLIEALGDWAPAPRAQEADARRVEATEEKMTSFVFKIQANMDPAHRDRIAFFRICSGKFTRGMKVMHHRLGKEVNLSNATVFMAQERSHVDEAYPGDIIGIHNHGTIKIGDTFSDKEELKFTGIPNFAPEHFRRVVLRNPLKMKQLQKGLVQMAEEGAVQVFRPVVGNEYILGAVGVLQFEVTMTRLKDEYGVDATYEPLGYTLARWVSSDNKQQMREFEKKAQFNLFLDAEGHLSYLAEGSWRLAHTQELFPEVVFHKTRESV
jgi:peptide chain release factor 3